MSESIRNQSSRWIFSFVIGVCAIVITDAVNEYVQVKKELQKLEIKRTKLSIKLLKKQFNGLREN